MSDERRRYAREFIATYQPTPNGPALMRVLHDIAIDHPGRLPSKAETEAIVRFSITETWTPDPRLEGVVRHRLLDEGLLRGRAPKRPSRRRQPRDGIRRHRCEWTAWVSNADGTTISRRCLDPGCAVLVTRPRSSLQPGNEGCHPDNSFACQDATG